MSTPGGAASERQLPRELGAGHAAAIVVGTVIGSGIFLVPAEMMQAVGSPGLVYLAWIAGGVLSFFGALTYAELAALRPQTGGEYAYLRDAYGPLFGFLNSWTWFMIAKPASIATVTAGIVRTLGEFSVFSFLPSRVFAPLPVTYEQVVAISCALFISGLNYIGIRKAADFQLVFTILKVAMICAIVAVGFSYVRGSIGNFSTRFQGAQGGIAGFMAALVAALWAYDGWNDLTMVSGEVRRPERNLPIGLIGGVAVLIGLYMAVNAAVQYVMPAAVVAVSKRPAADAVEAVLGAWGAAALSVGIAVSMLVTLNGTVMSGARPAFAMARDGYFFRALAEVHPRFRTPSTAIVVQAIMAILLLLLAGTFKQLFSLSIFSEWLIYMAAAGTVFVFRRRGDTSPYRMWGYPVVPAVFIASSGVLLYYTFLDNLRNSIAGSLIIAAGIPIFYFFARRKRSVEHPGGGTLGEPS
ncbi:MAG: amino acid permease [Acidobacteriia bacterium]|nr:amino acid permease [Terriglobia bacterium]